MEHEGFEHKGMKLVFGREHPKAAIAEGGKHPFYRGALYVDGENERTPEIPQGRIERPDW